MKFFKGLLCVGLVAYAVSYAGSDVMEDKRDGKVYHKVDVGGNTWLAENLNFASKNSYCYNDVASCNQDGRLYTWEIAMMACPEGWRLPTDAEWNALLKSLGGWQNLAKNGFNVPMAGDRRADGVYHYKGESAFYWSSTPSGKKYFRYKFDAGKGKHDRSSMVDGPAYTVKCVAGIKSCSSPLMNAVRAGDINKVKLLLDAGARVNEDCYTENEKEMTSIGDSYEGYSYLGMAIDKGNEAMVRFLLDRGANPNGVDVSGPSEEQLSMLIRATNKGNKKILGALLDKGAEVGFCDVSLSSTANADVLEMLVKKLDVDEINHCWYGYSLVDQLRDQPKIQRLLIQRGGKSGSQICPAGQDGEIPTNANDRMCGD